MALLSFVDLVGPPIPADYLNELDMIRQTMVADLNGALTVGTPTGGFQGAGTINAEGVFVNGVPFLTAAVDSVVGTVNQIDVNSVDPANPVLSLAAPVLAGLALAASAVQPGDSVTTLTGLAAVAITGAYADLSGKPTIPADVSSAAVLGASDITATFPNSRRLVAGTGVSFDDTVANVRTVNAGTASFDHVTNGFEVFTSGLVLQWGFHSFDDNPATVTFPMVFPNACLNVQLCPVLDPVVLRDKAVTLQEFNATNFILEDSDGSDGTYWFAIGF